MVVVILCKQAKFGAETRPSDKERIMGEVQAISKSVNQEVDPLEQTGMM